jgi:hypothetical protein
MAYDRDDKTLKRLNVNLPASRIDRLQVLAKRSGTPMTSIVRSALNLLEGVAEDLRQGHRIAVIDSSGKTIKEIYVAL